MDVICSFFLVCLGLLASMKAFLVCAYYCNCIQVLRIKVDSLN